MNYVPIERLVIEEAKKLKKLTPWQSTYKTPVARKLFDEENMAPLKYGLENRNPFRINAGGGNAEPAPAAPAAPPTEGGDDALREVPFGADGEGGGDGVEG